MLRRLKSLFSLIVSFAVGVLLSSLIWWQYLEYLDLTRRSSVDQPLAAIIDNIAVAGRMDCQLAALKAEMLRVRWQDYLQGAATPEQFRAEVVAATVPE